MMLLSVLIPVYDERRTLGSVLTMVSRSLPEVDKEIIVIDDCSRDGTREWLNANFSEGDRHGSTVELANDGNLIFADTPGSSQFSIRIVYHERNKGKERR
jgi:glycosyltransferase involved in cell wall biosynthesis